MRIRVDFIPSIVLSLVVLGLLVLGIPFPGVAGEPHVCINGNQSAMWQNLGSTTQIKWGYGAGCNHSSNVIRWYFYVYNYYNQTSPICSATNGGSGWTIPPDPDPHTVNANPACTGGTIPKGSTVKLKARVWYQTVGSGWMYHDDYLTNN
jgi:hypothetical protein